MKERLKSIGRNLLLTTLFLLGSSSIKDKTNTTVFGGPSSCIATPSPFSQEPSSLTPNPTEVFQPSPQIKVYDISGTGGPTLMNEFQLTGISPTPGASSEVIQQMITVTQLQKRLQEDILKMVIQKFNKELPTSNYPIEIVTAGFIDPPHNTTYLVAFNANGTPIAGGSASLDNENGTVNLYRWLIPPASEDPNVKYHFYSGELVAIRENPKKPIRRGVEIGIENGKITFTEIHGEEIAKFNFSTGQWESLPPTPAETATPMESSRLNRDEVVDLFLKGEIPSPNEELFRLTINSKTPEEIGYYRIIEAQPDYPEMGKVQLINLGGRKEGDKIIMTAGTIDPTTKQRIIVEICVGISNTKYFAKTYIINTRTGYPYIGDYGKISSELLPGDDVIKILQDNVGKPVIVTFFLAPLLDSSYLEEDFAKYPGYKEEYENYLLPSFELNKMLLQNPARLADLQKENKNNLPYTYGPIKFWFMRSNN